MTLLRTVAPLTATTVMSGLRVAFLLALALGSMAGKAFAVR
jgi:hypothetical protein